MVVSTERSTGADQKVHQEGKEQFLCSSKKSIYYYFIFDDF